MLSLISQIAITGIYKAILGLLPSYAGGYNNNNNNNSNTNNNNDNDCQYYNE